MGSGAAMQTPRTELSQLLFTRPFADKIQCRQPVQGFSFEFSEVSKYSQDLEVEWFTVLLPMIYFFVSSCWLTPMPELKVLTTQLTSWDDGGVGTNPALTISALSCRMPTLDTSVLFHQPIILLQHVAILHVLATMVKKKKKNFSE